jgi:hypothetical protein
VIFLAVAPELWMGWGAQAPNIYEYTIGSVLVNSNYIKILSQGEKERTHVMRKLSHSIMGLFLKLIE